MSKVTISDAIRYVGVDDKDIDLFESQFIVPNGVSYNSYLIMDEKVALMDSVDGRKTDEWLSNIETELDGRLPDYLIVSHMEPDHSVCHAPSVYGVGFGGKKSRSGRGGYS